MKSKTILFGLASMAAFGFVSCANDELKEVYAGEEIRFTTRVSRSTPTTLENLDGFYVYANAEGYSNLLINGMKAMKENEGEYSLDSKVTWPVDVNKIHFWAYGPLKQKDNVSAEFTVTGHSLKGFSVESDMVDGGKKHTDLVVAYTGADRQVQVPLTFNHALSQVEVRIKKGAGSEEGRVVKIKGAWLVNAHSKGDFQFSSSEENNYISWETSTPAAYGRKLLSPTKLGTATHNVISNENIGGNSSGLMMLPQNFIEYPFKSNANAAAEMELNEEIGINNSGTYILVLCRVETFHDYEANATGTAENPAVGDRDDGKPGHSHQLFPVTKDANGNLVFKADAYGYTCVPISGKWLPGKKYVYTLEFCGKSSGAGVYPPEPLPDGLDPETPRPDDKEPGTPVLDSAISFSVTVSDWTTEDVKPNVK